MKRRRGLVPDHYYTAVRAIDLPSLREEGVRALLVDFDNTLSPRKSNEVAEEVVMWLAECAAAGFEVCIVSNNWGSAILGIAEKLGVRIVARGTKPLPFAFRRALRLLGVTAGEAAVVGDQVFTDVLGGRLVGAKTVLVQPLCGADLPHTLVLRLIERFILADTEPRS